MGEDGEVSFIGHRSPDYSDFEREECCVCAQNNNQQEEIQNNLQHEEFAMHRKVLASVWSICWMMTVML